MFHGRDNTRKTCVVLYLCCGPLKKSQLRVQNIGAIKTKTDTKCYENLLPNYLQNIAQKTLRTLLVREFVFNNKLVIRL